MTHTSSSNRWVRSAEYNNGTITFNKLDQDYAICCENIAIDKNVDLLLNCGWHFARVSCSTITMISGFTIESARMSDNFVPVIRNHWEQWNYVSRAVYLVTRSIPYDAEMLSSRSVLRHALRDLQSRVAFDRINIRDMTREDHVSSTIFYRQNGTKADVRREQFDRGSNLVAQKYDRVRCGDDRWFSPPTGHRSA